jgi:hypothetical protein
LHRALTRPAALVVAAACSALAPDVTVAVSVVDGITQVAPGASVMVLADVRHTQGYPPVTWTLDGPACPAACGSLSMIADDSVTYTAPVLVFAATTVTITATSMKDPSKSASVTLTLEATNVPSCGAGARNGALSGPYAFLLRGGGPSGPFAMAGSFVADAAGHITSGTVDVNRARGAPAADLPIDAAHSSYAVGADGRGCLALTTSSTTMLLHISVGTAELATRGSVIEFDATAAGGSAAEGFLRRQDTTAFTADALAGGYAFGLWGTDEQGLPSAAAGVVTADHGALADGVVDSVGVGTPIVEVTGLSGSYAVGAAGRGTLVLAGATYMSYAVSAAEVLFLAMDPIDMTHALWSGELRAQVGAPFDATALAAPAIFYAIGHDPAVNGAGTATIGLWTGPDTTGKSSLLLDRNDGGTFTSLPAAKTAYTVGANGRTTLLFDLRPAVVFLYGSGTGFMVMKDPGPSLGSVEPQSGAPFSAASLTGAYFYGTMGVNPGNRLTAVGALMVAGAGLAIIEDEATTAMTAADQDVSSSAFSVDASGRATLDPAGHRVAWLISPSRFVFINTPAGRPRVVIVER